MIEVLSEIKDNPDFIIHDIAGNKKIALTYRESTGDKSSYEGVEEIFRYQEIDSISRGRLLYKDRVTVLVPVSHIRLLFDVLRSRGITIDHFYDY